MAKKLRKGLKPVLTFDDKPQIQIGSKGVGYDYRVYVLEEGQRIVWGSDNKYYSVGPGLLEVQFHQGMKTLEGYLDCEKIWSHVRRLMQEGWEHLRNG